MSFEETLLTNSYVVEGRISRYGTVVIRSKNTPESSYHPWDGLVLYSDELIGMSSLQAKIDGETLQVLHGKDTAVLEAGNLFVADKSRSGHNEVMARGWLRKAWTYRTRDGISKDDILFQRKLAAILRRAERGIKPPYFDGSPFVKVDPVLRRRIVMLLCINPLFSFEEEEFRVIDSKGRIVPCEVHFPLSRQKWIGKTTSP